MAKGIKKPRVALIFPHRWDAMAPFLAIPQLAGYLRTRGVSVKAIDLNLLLVRWMLSEEGTGELVRAARAVVELPVNSSYPDRSEFAGWATVWLGRVPEDHRRLRQRLLRSRRWSARDLHQLEVLISRSWEIVEMLDAAVRENPSVPAPHRQFVHRHLERVIVWKPDIVGFSAATQHQLLSSLAYADMLREAGCTARFVAGGSAVSSAFGPHFSAAALPQEIDCVVVGPGEDALMQLVTMLQNGEPWPRRLRGPEPQGTTVRLPDSSTFDARSYLWPRYSYPFPFSDGCRWRRCSFCGVYCTHKYRSTLPDHIVAPLRLLTLKFGCVSFFNTGAELAAQDAADIASALERNKLKVRWQTMARADRAWTEQLCRYLVERGFEYVLFGIESLSDRILRDMRKGLSAEEQIAALGCAAKSGLKPAVSLIFGFPGETLRDLEITLNALEPFLGNLSYLSLMRFHLDRTSMMAAQSARFGLETGGNALASVRSDDVFQIKYRDTRRDPNHLDQALRFFDRWILEINRKRSILFAREPSSIHLGFDFDFYFEGRHPSRERLDDYFSLDAILARRYSVDQRQMKFIQGGADSGYYHRYVFQPIAKDTAQAKVISALETGMTVGDAFEACGISPDRDLSAFLSLVQMINGLDLLRVLVTAGRHRRQPHGLHRGIIQDAKAVHVELNAALAVE
jgi:hypothetical protein